MDFVCTKRACEIRVIIIVWSDALGNLSWQDVIHTLSESEFITKCQANCSGLKEGRERPYNSLIDLHAHNGRSLKPIAIDSVPHLHITLFLGKLEKAPRRQEIAARSLK